MNILEAMELAKAGKRVHDMEAQDWEVVDDAPPAGG